LVGKVIGWVILILVIVWIISDPAKAGAEVHSWITGVVSFFSHLANG